jgi:hypothetical protein
MTGRLDAPRRIDSLRYSSMTITSSPCPPPPPSSSFPILARFDLVATRFLPVIPLPFPLASALDPFPLTTSTLDPLVASSSLSDNSIGSRDDEVPLATAWLRRVPAIWRGGTEEDWTDEARMEVVLVLALDPDRGLLGLVGAATGLGAGIWVCIVGFGVAYLLLAKSHMTKDQAI